MKAYLNRKRVVRVWSHSRSGPARTLAFAYEVLLTHFIRLHTPRLLLDDLRISDSEALNAMRNDPAVRRYLAEKPFEDLTATKALIRTICESNAAGGGLNYAVRINGDDKLIGFVGVWRIDPEKREAEIGYMLAPAQWNRGLAGEALGALMQQADICLPNYRFVAQVHHAHKASIRLLERFGFQLAPANGIEDVDCVRYVRPAYQPGE